MSGKIIFCLLIFLTATLVIRSILYFSSQPKHKSGDSISYQTTLLSEPKLNPRGQQLFLTLSNGQNILITLPPSPKISYGDVVEIKGKLKERKIGSPWGEAGEKSVFTLNYPQIYVKKEEQNPILAAGGEFRHKISAFYKENLPPVSSSLLLGIVFGIKESMPKDFQDLLGASGVTHVIAASGMNISMVGGFFAVFFTKLVRRKIALFLTIFAIIFYALLSGLDPSILRAGIMGSIGFGAQILGRQNNSIFALLLTAFVMLFISPILIFDLGFALSFMSTVGILILNPILSQGLSKIKILRAIEGDLVTTLSAQIFTFPIILGTFGSYSLVSVLVNGLVLWTVPILMVLGALGALLGIVFTPLGVLVLYLAYPLLIYFEFMVRNLGSLGFSFTASYLPISITLGYYLILSAVLYKLILRVKTK